MPETTDQDDTSPDRRGDDRRKARAPFDGKERRKADRRSGRDRRRDPRDG